MNQTQLEFPVLDYSGQQLLPAGTILTEAVMADLAAAGRKRAWSSAPFLEHGTVGSDLKGLLRIGAYQEVFTRSSDSEVILRELSRVVIPMPVLRSLDYFREHDFYTYRHILMVAALAALITRDLVPADRQEQIPALVSPIHDGGKTCVPLRVLKKRSALTRPELAHLHHHAVAGYVQLAYYYGDADAFPARIARDHHERRNGSGYPLGKTEVDPLIEIIAACDIFDALISPRPYRKASYDRRTALEEISRLAHAGALGMESVQGLVALNRSDRPHFSAVSISLENRGLPPVENCYGIIAESETGADVAPDALAADAAVSPDPLPRPC